MDTDNPFLDFCSMLLRLTYQFPSDTDRYIDLMKWCADYLEQNKRTGLRIMVTKSILFKKMSDF